MTISAVKADNTAAATSVANVASHFANQTTATVSWASIPATTAGTAITSPNISTILQEIVDRPGWTNNNNVVILFSGGSSAVDAESYEDDSSRAPRISVTYEIPAGIVLPPVTSTFYWQLQGTVPTNRSEQVYDIDGFDNNQAKFTTLRNAGKYVIAYFSAGTYENWRPDQASFPSGVKGNNVDGWAGEKWLDVRAVSTLQPIMEARADLAKTKGAHAIEWDNLDGYDNSPGFSINATQQRTYLQMLADITHARGMAAIFKNVPQFSTWASSRFDGCICEEAYEWDEISDYMPFRNAGKPVWAVEYNGTLNCSDANSRGIYLAKFPLDLDGAPVSVCTLP